jgi:hypothetical protein
MICKVGVDEVAEVEVAGPTSIHVRGPPIDSW